MMKKLLLTVALLIGVPVGASAQIYFPAGSISFTAANATATQGTPLACRTHTSNPTPTDGFLTACSISSVNGGMRVQVVGSDVGFTSGLQNPANSLSVVISGGTPEWYISTGSTEDEHQIKATSGVLRGMNARNTHASTAAFIRCTNATAAGTTPGSTTIIYELMVPAGPGATNDRNVNLAFASALTCYIVTGEAANNTDEVASGDVAYSITTD